MLAADTPHLANRRYKKEIRNDYGNALGPVFRVEVKRHGAYQSSGQKENFKNAAEAAAAMYAVVRLIEDVQQPGFS